jgi:hypothetical protein
MKYSTHPLCRCTDPGTGKLLGQRCPDLWRKDGSWNPGHGSMGWAARIPTTSGVNALRDAASQAEGYTMGDGTT